MSTLEKLDASPEPTYRVPSGLTGRSRSSETPLGGNAVDGVRRGWAWPARVRPEQDDLVRQRVARGELKARQARGRHRAPVRRQGVEVVRVEQVDEAVGGKRAVDGYAEQPAVPVAVHPPRDVEDRGCRARPWLHHLRCPSFSITSIRPSGVQAVPTGPVCAARDRPLLESGRIRRGAPDSLPRRRAQRPQRRRRMMRAKRVCSASPGPSRCSGRQEPANTSVRVNAETASADILRGRAWR